MTTQAQDRADQERIDDAFAEVRFEQRIVEREHARIFRPIHNRVYVDNLRQKTYDAIIAALQKGEKKKTLAQRMRVPYNIVIYIWEHDLRD